jgi:hypothetical protein
MTYDDFRTLDPSTPLLDSVGLPDEVKTFITNLPAEQWAALRLTVGAVLYRAVEAELLQLREENQRLRAQLQGPRVETTEPRPRRSSDPFDKADLPDDQ